jgi:hypothetical protein
MCKADSGWVWQSWQIRLDWLPCLIIRSVIHNLFCWINHRRTCIWVPLLPTIDYPNHGMRRNQARYADCTEYEPLVVNRHLMSSACSASWIWLRWLRRVMNCWSSLTVDNLWNPRIHAHPLSDVDTVLFFRHASRNSKGTMSLGADLFNHWSCQTLVVSPLPRVVDVQVLNRAIFVAEEGMVIPFQGLEQLFGPCHCHRRRNTWPKRSRSRMSNPPRLLGHWTCFQFTRHWPRCLSSEPCHKKLLRIMSIFFRVHLDNWKMVIW